MLYQNKNKMPMPKPRQVAPAMKLGAARMASEGEEAKAPIVPTTNLKVTAAKQAAAAPTMPTQPQGMSTAMATQPAAPAQPAAAPAAPQAAPQQAGGNIDELLSSNTTRMLQGQYNTAADERAIRELMESQAGQQSSDLAARLGAFGGGSSGALGALQGNMRAEAARQAAADIIGVRERAADRQRADVTAAAQMAAQQAEQARMDEALRQAGVEASGGYEDADGNGRDDTTGVAEADWQAHLQGSANLTNENSWNLFNPTTWKEGGQLETPFIIEPNEADFAMKYKKLVPVPGRPNTYKGNDGKYYTLRGGGGSVGSASPDASNPFKIRL